MRKEHWAVAREERAEGAREVHDALRILVMVVLDAEGRNFGHASGEVQEEGLADPRPQLGLEVELVDAGEREDRREVVECPA